MLEGSEPGISGVGAAAERGLSYRRRDLAFHFAYEVEVELQEFPLDVEEESAGSDRPLQGFLQDSFSLCFGLGLRPALLAERKERLCAGGLSSSQGV